MAEIRMNQIREVADTVATDGDILKFGNEAWSVADPGNDLVLIEKVIISGDTETFSFENIPSGFDDLRIVARVRADINFEMRFGAGGVIDTGANYGYAAGQDGTSESEAVDDSHNMIMEPFGYALVPNSANDANDYLSGEIYIQEYAEVDGYGVYGHGQGGGIRGTAGRFGVTFFRWDNTTEALDTIQFGNISGSADPIRAGSVFKLYGVGQGAQLVTEYGTATQQLTDGSDYESWPTILRDPDNSNLVVTWSEGTRHYPSEAARSVKQIISDDDGVTWGSETTIINTSEGDTMFGVGLDSSGNLLGWHRGRTPNTTTVATYDLYRSTDNGSTWSLYSSPSWTYMPTVIKNIISVPTVGLMAAWHADSNTRWGIVTSDDDGLTWTQTVVGSGLDTDEWPVEVNFAYISSVAGRILGLGRTQVTGGSARIFQLESDDYGATWTVEETNIVAQQSLAAIVYDATDDVVNVAYYARGTGKLYHIQVDPDTVWGSPTSWPTPTSLASGSTSSADTGYADMVTEGDGSSSAHIVWYDKTASGTQIKYIEHTV